MVPNPFRSRRETRRRPPETAEAEEPKTVHSEAAEEDVEPCAEAVEALREETGESPVRLLAVPDAAVAKASLPKTWYRRTNDIQTGKIVVGVDNDRPQIRPCQVLPSD